MIGAVAGFGPSTRIAPVGVLVRIVPVTARIDPALAEQIVEKCRGRSTA